MLTIFLTSIIKGIMKLDIHKFMNLNEFFSVPISNLFQKGKMMKLAKSLMTILIAATFAIAGCMQQDSSETVTSNPNDGVEQDTILEVSLGGASRAERFMGSFDEIDRLALDVIRNYGNKEVVHDLKMDNSTGVWKATVPNLIVGFEYTVKGHAYRPTTLLKITG